VEIAVDVPLAAEVLEIRSVCDGVDWQPSRVSLKNGFLSMWVRGLARNADRNNVRVTIGGRRQFATFVGTPGADGATQVNVRVGPNLAPGRQRLELRFGSVEAPPAEVEITS
jgi:hypothetical protein